MEPISTSIALLLTGLGLFGSSKRREAARERNAAAVRVQQAHEDAHSQSVSTCGSAVELNRSRVASTAWLLPRVDQAYSALGQAHRLYGVEGILGKRTRDAAFDLACKARANFPSLEFKGDAVMLAASSAALVLKGVDYLDQVHGIDVPVLHEPLSDAIASLPFDSAETVSHAFGSFGALSVAEVLADCLIVFSAFRLIYTYGKTKELRRDTDALDSEAQRLRKKERELEKFQQALKAVETEQSEATYQAYKAVTFASAYAANRDSIPASVGKRIYANLAKQSAAWWNSLQQEPKPT